MISQAERKQFCGCVFCLMNVINDVDYKTDKDLAQKTIYKKKRIYMKIDQIGNFENYHASREMSVIPGYLWIFISIL